MNVRTDDTRAGESEQPRRRGQLKIYLGYAPGVGKTAALLDGAHRRQDEGIDIVVAVDRPERYAETGQMLETLERIPPRQVEHRGATLFDLDVDAVLARRPHLAVVANLAHSNAPGSRHVRRYQDVEELLDAGIDVYTTLDIYEIESLTDIVAQITGLTVDESVPDRVLDEADVIECVDRPPTDVIHQAAARSETPLGNSTEPFYRPGNLAALRELMFRRAAEHIDEDLRSYMRRKDIAGPWPAGERVLVCVSPSPLSERLVRAGRRLANRLDAEWRAVYVETPAHARLSEAERSRITHTLRLAEALGAQSVTLPGRSVAEAVATYARRHNVTKIVAGKPLRSRWAELLHGSVVDRIIRESQNIDVYVISSVEPEPFQRIKPASPGPEVSWRRYAESAALVVVATLFGLLVRPFIAPTNLVMLYLLVVVVAAVRHGRGPSVTVAMLSVVVFDFFFVPPWYTFAVADAQYLLTFAGLLIVGLVISTLAARAREQMQAARRREMHSTASYELSRDLAAAGTIREIAKVVRTHVSRTFGCDVAVFLPAEDRLEPIEQSPGFPTTDDDRAAAQWVFEHGKPAGQSTDTLASAEARFIPLRTAQTTVGVLGVYFEPETPPPTPEQRRLLETFASQAALAVERGQLAEKASQAQLLRAKEQFQTALLDSISHDLRTPLASITGVLSSLREDEAYLDAAARDELIATAWEESERLNRLVGNLLDMTRLESGSMRVARELCDVQDVIGVALAQLSDPLRARTVQIDVEEDIPLVPMDFVLMTQVLVNLLDNAIKYSPARSPIAIEAHRCSNQDALEIAVADRGAGIPDSELDRVFDKFYRVQRAHGAGGTGVGLSISKGIVEAHGGDIRADNRPDGGAIFRIRLPLEQPAVVLEEAQA